METLATLTGELARDLRALKQQLEPCGDIVFREFQASEPVARRAALVYGAFIVDTKLLERQVLDVLMLHGLDSQEVSAELPG